MKRSLLIALAVVQTAAGLIVAVQPAFAANAASWQSGNIIDDAVFTDRNSLDVNQIQDFLNRTVGTAYYGRVPGQCDTYGVRTSENGGGTRAQWAASKGYPTTFTCLKDYYEVPKTAPGPGIPANNYGGKAIPAGAISSAQMIYNAAQRYNISPKVLLVTIQKESAGPLTTDDWPLEKQYTYAMGAHCPDSGPNGSANCDANYAGFSIQIAESAALFRYYLDNMNQPWWPYKKLGNNNVLFNPNASCGASNVAIQSSATAALYTYTPYQPNQAALSNLYGTGDGCSAYGNRNFWRIYSDWFGSTRASLVGCVEAYNTARSCAWYLRSPSGQPYYTSNPTVRDDLINVQGYQYQSVGFFGNAIPLAGNIPVYRADQAGGGSFLTTGLAEYNVLLANGWTGRGIDFYADPVGSNSGYPVYRLIAPATGVHMWTTDLNEVNNLLASGYASEGIAFTSISTVRQETAPPAGKELVYRFYMPASVSHFWTTGVNERDVMIKAGYPYEGVAWQSMKTAAGNQPVYRLYAPSIKQHLYTTGLNERSVLLQSGGWVDEGISQYVSATVTSTPVYRLYAPSLGTHHLTTDSNERSVLVRSGGWVDEGTAWYQP